MTATLLGGIGLFLLGMTLLTDGLKAAAGDALRRILSRFVGGTFSALASGAAVTALVQSSSATTLTTIGFVSAGLVTFPQAVGVVLGANLGTTSTGWLVSLLGLKLSVGQAALPLIGVGALARLLSSGRLAALGTALAGFGLVFVGIDYLQSGMAGLAEKLDPGTLAGEGLLHRVLLVGLGVVMTVVLQSSSAAVAATLTALDAGAIGLPEAAALVVGQNVGTTVTAALACIGASLAARRTAVAHILFNGLTALAAFVALPVFVRLAGGLAGADGNPTLALAAFHTAFNLLGVLIVLPWLRSFARLVERLVPDRGAARTATLDATVAAVPAVAVEASRRVLLDATAGLVAALRLRMVRPDGSGTSPGPARAALAEVRRFLGAVHSEPETEDVYRRHLRILHALDHLERLGRVCSEELDAAAVSELLQGPLRDATTVLVLGEAWVAGGGTASAAGLAEISVKVADARRAERRETLTRTAAGRIDPERALARLQALQWVDRAVYHLSRAADHLSGGGAATAAEEPGAVEP